MSRPPEVIIFPAPQTAFCLPTTITGSIGAGIIPNMQDFLKASWALRLMRKTGYADAGSVYRPLNENEKDSSSKCQYDLRSSNKEWPMGEKRYGLCRQYCAGSCMDKAPGQRELD
jgi:hypothetical protein